MTLFPSTRPRIAGVLLAAGLGRRFGGPKALADTGSGPWVLRALATLGALDPRLVVVGAAADDVVALLPRDVVPVKNPDFAGGMGSSLAAALRALQGGLGAGSGVDSTAGLVVNSAVDAAVIMLVDLPDAGAAMAMALATTSTGAVSRFETTPLFSASDAMAAMRKAQAASYSPPA